MNSILKMNRIVSCFKSSGMMNRNVKLDRINFRYSNSIRNIATKNTLIKTSNKTVDSFGISNERQSLLKRNGINELFPIQVSCFNPIMNGENLVAQAPTGQGKTLAFVLPILELLSNKPSKLRKPEVLILSPTRELVQQTYTECMKYSLGIKCVSIYGGVSYTPQEDMLNRGARIIIGTPGRLNDLIETRHTCDLSNIKYIILDEADRMLEMGFKEQLDNILGHCQQKQNIQYLFFSATIPQWIDQVINIYMNKKPLIINLTSDKKASTDVNHCYFLLPNNHPYPTKSLIYNIHNQCCKTNNNNNNNNGDGKTLIFCERKKDCDILLTKLGNRISGVLHGDISQNQRLNTINEFKRNGNMKILIATDVASRGLDINNIDLVMNLNLPRYQSRKLDIQSYIHRSGRTGRAGKKGTCISLISQREMSDIYYIQKQIHNSFTEFKLDNIDNKNIEGSTNSYIMDMIEQAKPNSKSLQGLMNQLNEKYGYENALLRAVSLLNKEDELFTDEEDAKFYNRSSYRQGNNDNNNSRYRHNNNNREGRGRNYNNNYSKRNNNNSFSTHRNFDDFNSHSYKGRNSNYGNYHKRSFNNNNSNYEDDQQLDF